MGLDKNAIECANDIVAGLDKLKDTFIDTVKESANKLDINSTLLTSSPSLYDMMQAMVFGVDSGTPIKKVDLGKNRNLVKKLFINFSNMQKTVRWLRDMVMVLEEELYKVKLNFRSTIVQSDSQELRRLDDIITFFYSEAMRASSAGRMLTDILYSTGLLKFDKSYTEELQPIQQTKPDTLKRYYFNDLYTIKTGFVYFDTSKMVFGESNTIVKLYNIITDFLFKDFITFYNTIYINLTEIIKKSTK